MEVFTSEDVEKILWKKLVVVIGDSVQRCVYKDLVCLLAPGSNTRYLTSKELKAKGEIEFLGDKLLVGGQLGDVKTGVNYREVRQCDSQTTLLKFYFVTRCYSGHMESILNELKTIRPHVIIMNSCLWDLHRYGPSGHKAYMKNMDTLMFGLKKAIPDDAVFIWNATLPLDSKCKGGFLLPYFASIPSQEIIEANFTACHIVVSHGFTFLDLHSIFMHQLNHRAADGIHWNHLAHRRISNLILIKLCRIWNMPIPQNRAPDIQRRSPLSYPPKESLLSSSFTSFPPFVDRYGFNAPSADTRYVVEKSTSEYSDSYKDRFRLISTPVSGIRNSSASVGTVNVKSEAHLSCSFSLNDTPNKDCEPVDASSPIAAADNSMSEGHLNQMRVLYQHFDQEENQASLGNKENVPFVGIPSLPIEKSLTSDLELAHDTIKCIDREISKTVSTTDEYDSISEAHLRQLLVLSQHFNRAMKEKRCKDECSVKGVSASASSLTRVQTLTTDGAVEQLSAGSDGLQNGTVVSKDDDQLTSYVTQTSTTSRPGNPGTANTKSCLETKTSRGAAATAVLPCAIHNQTISDTKSSHDGLGSENVDHTTTLTTSGQANHDQEPRKHAVNRESCSPATRSQTEAPTRGQKRKATDSLEPKQDAKQARQDVSERNGTDTRRQGDDQRPAMNLKRKADPVPLTSVDGTPRPCAQQGNPGYQPPNKRSRACRQARNRPRSTYVTNNLPKPSHKNTSVGSLHMGTYDPQHTARWNGTTGQLTQQGWQWPHDQRSLYDIQQQQVWLNTVLHRRIIDQRSSTNPYLNSLNSQWNNSHGYYYNHSYRY